jgi:creatinine amidohydrolase
VSELLPTTTSADETDRGATVAVLPVGSFEQHGDHLPNATDSMIAVIIAREIAEAHNLFLPPITIGCSHEHAGWAGTVSISASTLHAMINDIAASLANSGIHRLLIVNGHGGKLRAVQRCPGSLGERATDGALPRSSRLEQRPGRG